MDCACVGVGLPDDPRAVEDARPYKHHFTLMEFIGREQAPAAYKTKKPSNNMLLGFRFAFDYFA